MYLNISTTNKMKKLVTMRSAPKNSCQIRWKILSNLFEFQEVNDYK